MKTISFLCGIMLILTGCASMDVGGLSEHMGLINTAVKTTYNASRPISDEEEYYVGRAVAARILSTYPLMRNKALTAYVNAVGQTVAIHSNKPYTFAGYHFAILDSKEKNAFACPGGIIFITKGMLYAVRNEDELAGVLAHEIAHINNRDGIASIKSSRWTEALTIIGTEAVKQYGEAELAELVTVFEGSIDDVFKTLVVNGYSKSQEYRADEEAIVYLSRAGYNVIALKDFLARIYQQEHTSGGGILQTHPATIDRIQNIAEDLPASKVNKVSLKRRTYRFNYFCH